jgi:hypothetical protein
MDIRQALIQAEGDVLAAAELVLASARTKNVFERKKVEKGKVEYEDFFQVMQHDGTFGKLGKVIFKEAPYSYDRKNMLVSFNGLNLKDPDAKEWEAAELDLTVFVKDISDDRGYVKALKDELETGVHSSTLGLATFAQSMKHSGLTYYDPKKVVVVTPRKTAERPEPVRQYAYKKL